MSDDLERLGRAVGQVDSARPRARFRGELRSRLLAHGRPAGARRRAAPLLRPALAAVVAVLLGAGGGAAIAASLPDEPPYAAKTAIEGVALRAAPDDAARVAVLERLMDARMWELERATALGKTDVAANVRDRYTALLDDLSRSIEILAARPRDGRDRAALAAAERIAGEYAEALATLATTTGDATLTGAADRSRAVEDAAHGALRTDGGGGGGDSAPPAGGTAATATPTSGPRATDTPHPTDSPTPVGTPRETATGTPHPTDTPSPAPTATATRSPDPTPTATAAPTVKPTATATATPSPSPTPTPLR